MLMLMSCSCPLEAALADPACCCSSLYTTKTVVNSMASGLGPLVSVVLFAFLGNSWEVKKIYWLVMACQW